MIFLSWTPSETTAIKDSNERSQIDESLLKIYPSTDLKA